jgi:predicted esterase
VAAERIVVGGFSQGGAMAYYSLRQPHALAGVFGALVDTAHCSQVSHCLQRRPAVP